MNIPQRMNSWNRVTRRQFVCGTSAIIAGAALRKSLGGGPDSGKKKSGLLQAIEYNHVSVESPANQEMGRAFHTTYFGLGRTQRFSFLEDAGFMNVRPGEEPGLNHCAIEIKDFDTDQVLRTLSGLGVEHYAAQGDERIYFYDPDGQRIQIAPEKFNYGVIPPKREESPKSPFRATRFNHISMNVTDVAKTRDFYQELFGMEVHDEAKDGSSCFLSFGKAFIEFRKGKYAGLQHYCYELKEFDKDYVISVLKDMVNNYGADWQFIHDRGYATVLDESIITCMLVGPGHKPKVSS